MERGNRSEYQLLEIIVKDIHTKDGVRAFRELIHNKAKNLTYVQFVHLMDLVAKQESAIIFGNEEINK